MAGPKTPFWEKQHLSLKEKSQDLVAQESNIYYDAMHN